MLENHDACAHDLGQCNEPTLLYLAKSREAWARASDFPADKEAVYPEHAEAQEFERVRGMEVLEYGCGGGSDAMSYARRGNRVTAVDIVLRNIQTTRTRAGSLPINAILLSHSVPLPFPDGVFDVVNCHGVLHHIPEPEPVLQEFRRVLRQGGSLYLMLYTEHLWREFQTARKQPADMSFAAFTDGSPPPPYATFYFEDQAKVMLSSAGFHCMSTFEYNQHHFRTYRAEKLT